MVKESPEKEIYYSMVFLFLFARYENVNLYENASRIIPVINGENS